MPSSHASAVETRELAAAPQGIAQAAALLCAGKLVAFPTETVYGLGADATDPQAVARIYAAKGRPQFNPLIAHVASREAAYALGEFGPAARRLAEAFWPGPLTLVVPVGEDCPVSELARAGLASLGIRVPSHPVAQAMLEAAGRPIAGPSANRSGHVSPTLARHVLADLSGLIDAVLEGGAAEIGIESTIIGCTEGELTLLRPGLITRGAIEAATGEILREAGADTDAPVSPGRLLSHYAPRHPVRLDAERVEASELCLAFGHNLPEGATPARTLSLSPTGDLVEAAANLYHHLRALDAMEGSGIAVSPIPRGGIGEAILDRLGRAAAPREAL